MPPPPTKLAVYLEFAADLPQHSLFEFDLSQVGGLTHPQLQPLGQKVEPPPHPKSGYVESDSAPGVWACSTCQHVYDAATDDPAKQHSAFEQLPATWCCPVPERNSRMARTLAPCVGHQPTRGVAPEALDPSCSKTLLQVLSVAKGPASPMTEIAAKGALKDPLAQLEELADQLPGAEQALKPFRDDIAEAQARGHHGKWPPRKDPITAEELASSPTRALVGLYTDRYGHSLPLPAKKGTMVERIVEHEQAAEQAWQRMQARRAALMGGLGRYLDLLQRSLVIRLRMNLNADTRSCHGHAETWQLLKQLVSGTQPIVPLLSVAADLSYGAHRCNSPPCRSKPTRSGLLWTGPQPRRPRC